MLVPERDKVFPNLTVAENLVAPVPRGVSRAERRRREALVYQFFPRLADLQEPHRRTAVGRRAADARARQRASCAARSCCWSTSCRSGLAPVVVEDLLRRLVEIRRELGITILIVEQSAAVALADRRLRLRHGERPRRARRQRRAAARPRRHPGILPRPARAASAGATAT